MIPTYSNSAVKQSDLQLMKKNESAKYNALNKDNQAE